MAKLPSARYSRQYSENGFWKFVKRFHKQIGRETLTILFKLWFLIADGKASPRTIALVLAALGYAISPIDAIPDILPLLGLSDDVTVITATAAAVANDITPEITRKAERKAKEIIG